MAPAAGATATRSAHLLDRVRVRGFRSVHDIALEPGRLCALVGEAQAGKSNLLAAIRTLLDPGAPPLSRDDVAGGGDGHIHIEGTVGAQALSVKASPPEPSIARREGAPPVVFLPASERATTVVAPGTRRASAEHVLELFTRALAEPLGGAGGASGAAPALAFVDAIESCCAFGIRGLVLLIEEPELYLRPQAQRYLYRLLRELSLGGNQVIYSTHSPSFLNVARLEELVFVTRAAEAATRVLQPTRVQSEEEFRLLSEFDAERSELFLARAAVLVEGATEKFALPFVFRALGYDADHEGISIVECGGKSGIPLIGRVSRAVGVPAVAVHDRDAPSGAEPIDAERALNDLIADVVGAQRTVVLEPDFEGVSGLRGRSHKPERAWRRFTSLSGPEMPEPLVRAVELALGLARGGDLGEPD
jgi:hypothetical protein